MTAHLDHVLDPAVSEVHMFNDNSGMEIVSDLALVHYLLTSGSHLNFVEWQQRQQQQHQVLN